MKTIVTGGAGFIGSYLVRKLINESREVVVVDNLSSGSLDNLLNLGLKSSDFELKKIDLTDYHQTLEALKGADSVFHLAARIGGIKYLHGSESVELSTLQENLTIDANVFRACQKQGVEKVIYTSSSAVYSTEKQYRYGTVLSEDEFLIGQNREYQKFQFKMSINPDGGYGLAKILAEIQLNLTKNTRIGIARLFNVYGVQEPLDERSHAISDLIRKAINYPEEKFIVWGDGKQSRDYVYVTDCVESLIKIEEKISEISPLTVNIGSGKGTFIGEIAEKIIEISGKNIKPIYDSSKPVGPLSRTANIEKAKNLLNWQPKVNTEEGLRKTYSWVQKKLSK